MNKMHLQYEVEYIFPPVLNIKQGRVKKYAGSFV
jgi:hypothetical protein